MKNFIKNFSILAFVLLAMAAGVEAAGSIAGFVAGSVAYAGLQYAGVVELPFGAAYVNLKIGNVKRQNRQLDNQGGFTKMAIILPESFATHWPLSSHLGASGVEVTTPPTITVGEKFGNVVFDLDAGMLKSSRKGDIDSSNHSHEGSFSVSGVTVEQLTELEKTKGGCLLVGWDSDGRRWLAGSTKRPLSLEYDVDFGDKPDSKRKITAKFKRDGFKFPLLSLGEAVTLTLETLTELD
ncbi:hypothetical protein [Runella salmonicolor]|uniref:DUF3108 domain-containing protein n=1 Tax=Runella salmonicolor TaxID=2950278 RepID=A0ABT1FRW5_9BACT|nr:hypothetical protein [Runella salmonicolor]MCP1384457.1 hypothetical protein [Runella salmonicolor]